MTLISNLLGSKLPKLSLLSLSRKYCQNNPTPVLTLFTKDNCQLCDEALEKLEPFIHQVKLEIIDIEEEGREEEYDKFRYEIPVFFFNKKFLCKNFIDLDKFHAAVKLSQENDKS